jgi:hypothetical protein
MDLSSMVVLDSEQNIDIEASCEKFRKNVTLAAAARKNDLEVIATTVASVFEGYPGANITLPALTSMVLNKLNVHPSAFGAMKERVQSYVQEHTEAGNGITESGAPALFAMKKGKGGGFRKL